VGHKTIKQLDTLTAGNTVTCNATVGNSAFPMALQQSPAHISRPSWFQF